MKRLFGKVVLVACLWYLSLGQAQEVPNEHLCPADDDHKVLKGRELR